MSETPHIALGAPLEDRIAYATIVASMSGVDAQQDAAETLDVQRLCAALRLPDGTAEALTAVALGKDGTGLSRAVRVLRGSELRFTVLADVVAVAHADGLYDMGERKAASGLATALGVEDKQLRAIEQTVQEHARIHAAVLELQAATEAARPTPAASFADLAAKLAAVGVPVGAVMASGSTPVTFQALAVAALKAGTVVTVLPHVGGAGLIFALGLGGAAVLHHLAGLVDRHREPHD